MANEKNLNENTKDRENKTTKYFLRLASMERKIEEDALFSACMELDSNSFYKDTFNHKRHDGGHRI